MTAPIKTIREKINNNVFHLYLFLHYCYELCCPTLVLNIAFSFVKCTKVSSLVMTYAKYKLAYGMLYYLQIGKRLLFVFIIKSCLRMV